MIHQSQQMKFGNLFGVSEFFNNVKNKIMPNNKNLNEEAPKEPTLITNLITIEQKQPE